MKLLSVVGARPNFIKLAPLARQLASRADAGHVIVHTGQHYDIQMSGAFFDELGIPKPDYSLDVGSASHAAQTAAIMERLEPVLVRERPDVVLAYGDVNSTVAAALTAVKLGLDVGHVEAGLRSRDWTMPEEINRIVTDRIARILFTPSSDADANLLAEGVPPDWIHFVGNIMIDSLVHALPLARERDALGPHGVRPGQYVVATLHRPSNVDDPGNLSQLVAALRELSADCPVLFPVHPRTRQRIGNLGLKNGNHGRLQLLEPVGYLEMLGLVASAGLVLTDSGGLQEETTFLGIPCVTVRPNTERPITCARGTNRLVPPARDAVLQAATGAMKEGHRRRQVEIEKWDGRTAERIVGVLVGGER